MNGQEILGHEPGTSFSHTVTLASGTNTYTLVARDRAGNTSPPATATIVYDNVAPQPVTAVAGTPVDTVAPSEVQNLRVHLKIKLHS